MNKNIKNMACQGPCDTCEFCEINDVCPECLHEGTIKCDTCLYYSNYEPKVIK